MPKKSKILSIKVSWTVLKTHILDSRPLQYEEKPLGQHVYFKCFVIHHNSKYFANIYSPGCPRFYKGTLEADYNDFNDNYKAIIDADPPTDTGIAGTKVLVHQTSRILGTVTYFTGSSDDTAANHLVGGDVPIANKLKEHHEIGDPVMQSKYLDLNIVENDTYIHEGYIQWKGAINDEISVEIVPRVTTVAAGTNTFYNLFGGYLVVPAAGDGVTDVTDMALVEMPVNEFGKRSQAFWNADYNTTTHEYENVTAAPFGDGVYNMFAVEITLNRFANRVPLLGTGFMHLQTSDASTITHGLRIKVTGETEGTDHEWWWNCFATLHRKTTI